MASIYLRGNIWWGKWKQNGRTVRQSLRTRDKTEAKRWLRESKTRERQARLPGWASLTPPTESRVTWEEAAQDLLTYYESYGTRNPREASARLRQLTKYFGGWKVADIDTSAILSFVSDMRKRGRAAATVNLQLATLRKALRLAHEHGKLEKLPVVRMLRPAPPRAGFFEREAFEEVAAVLPVDLALAVRIGYTFGWRINSEVLSLIWRQVDFEAGTLRLELGTTKNREGRLVFLTPALREGLAAQRARVRALERELGAIIPHVFPVPDGRWKGKPRRSFTWTWRRACREAGRPGMLAHDLRRTAARNMVHLGVPERVVMAVMGHKTRPMLDRYCIVSPGDLWEATERLTNADNSRTIQAHAGDD